MQQYLVREIEHLGVKQEALLCKVLPLVVHIVKELHHRLHNVRLIVDEGDLALLAFLKGAQADSLEEWGVRADDKAADLPRLRAALDGEVCEFRGLCEPVDVNCT